MNSSGKVLLVLRGVVKVANKRVDLHGRDYTRQRIMNIWNSMENKVYEKVREMRD
jgi:hypothetical protein